MRLIEKRRCEITIKRPGGQIETIIHPKIDYMIDGVFAQMKVVMLNAGRGEPISYKNIEAVTEMEESDYVGNCHRCGAKIDTRKAYSQNEWSYFSGKKVQVITYYCSDCQTLLSNIGKGEVTAMEERKA